MLATGLESREKALPSRDRAVAVQCQRQGRGLGSKALPSCGHVVAVQC